MDQITGVLPTSQRPLGYSGFLSLVWLLFKANRSHKRLGVKTALTITLPIERWLK